MMNADQSKIYSPQGKIVDMRGNAFEPTQTNKISPQEAKEARGKKQHDIAEKKLQSLVLEYFKQSSSDTLGAHLLFDRFNNEWKVFATIKNKQQRDVKLFLNAFKDNVNMFLENAQKLVREQNEVKQSDESNQEVNEDL